MAFLKAAHMKFKFSRKVKLSKISLQFVQLPLTLQEARHLLQFVKVKYAVSIREITCIGDLVVTETCAGSQCIAGASLRCKCSKGRTGDAAPLIGFLRPTILIHYSNILCPTN